ncbi:MAG: efflux RND transporter permease subunit [Acidobacteria bacterium]|nr:efflux RND transporter permease subunit [Acidobacteriota bacterium]
MVRSGIAANLLLLFIVTAGLVSLTGLTRLTQEAFPESSLDLIEVSVSYPGAGSGEVEEALVVRIEEQVDGIDDVQEITSVATEGLASVTIQLKSGADVDRALADVQSAVDRIRTFPAQAERPRKSRR